MKEENQTIIRALNKYGKVPQQYELLNEIDRLNNIINKARRKLGEYKYYSTPTEEQNKENEKIIEEVYQILHENLYKLKALKENK